VRKKISLTGLLLAWLCANGAIWDVMQVFAWGKMFSEYATVLSVTDALAATFDPARRCHRCIAISEAKSAGQEQGPLPSAPAETKLVLACESPVQYLVAQSRAAWPAVQVGVAPLRIEPVILPPPRV
jgi:hypothetical protein